MIDQIGIAFTGVVAIFLTQAKNDKYRKMAPIFGLAGQPFWFMAAIDAHQWGILILNFLYAAAWAKGFYQNYLIGWSTLTRRYI